MEEKPKNLLLNKLRTNTDLGIPIAKTMIKVMSAKKGIAERGHRFIIAAYVSLQNNCMIDAQLMAFIAEIILDDKTIFEQLRDRTYLLNLKDRKLNALIMIADAVSRKVEKSVVEEAIKLARHHDASDEEILDAIVLASVLDMVNKITTYLEEEEPTEEYARQAAQMMAESYR